MRVKLEKPYLNEFFDIIQKDKDFQSWTAFSKKLKTTTRWSLKQIRNGTWTFSEETFYELLQVIVPNKQEYFRNKIKYLESDWWPKLRWKKKQCTVKEQLKTKNKPFQLELKARLWGYLAGDGSVFISKEENQKSNGYNVAFYPDDLEMAKCFQEAFLEIYNKNLQIKKSQYKNMFVLRARHKVAYFDLMKYCTYGTLNWKIHLDNLKTDKMKKEWLRAFFDCEATINKIIQIQSVNKKGIEEVKSLLLQFDIESSRIYEYHRKQKNWNTNYILNISKKDDLERYLNVVGFNHSGKKAKLLSLCRGG